MSRLAPPSKLDRVIFAVGWLVAIIGLGALLALATACTTEDAFTASTGETPAEFIERQCAEKMLDCQRVYAFTQPAENPLGRVELCVRAEDIPLAESLYGGPAELSPDKRFDSWRLLGVEPVCWYHCPPATGPGCNAFGSPGDHIGSCFCPEPAE